MGTRNFLIIKLRNLTGLSKHQLREFCLMQYCQWDGYPKGQGLIILKFLRNILEENRWQEFCDKCSKLEIDLTEGPRDGESNFLEPIKDDYEETALEKIKTAFVKDDKKYEYIAKKWGYKKNLAVTIRLFEEITASPDILKGRINYMKAHSRDTGAQMLSLIMNDQVHEVVFCEKEWPSNYIFCEWGYLIDCTNKQLLVYSTLRIPPEEANDEENNISSDEKQQDMDEENPLSFMNAIPLIGRFNIDNLPSDEEFCQCFNKLKAYH